MSELCGPESEQRLKLGELIIVVYLVARIRYAFAIWVEYKKFNRQLNPFSSNLCYNRPKHKRERTEKINERIRKRGDF